LIVLGFKKQRERERERERERGIALITNKKSKNVKNENHKIH
jgi:hypothetical protein